MAACLRHVRYTPNSDIDRDRSNVGYVPIADITPPPAFTLIGNASTVPGGSL